MKNGYTCFDCGSYVAKGHSHDCVHKSKTLPEAKLIIKVECPNCKTIHEIYQFRNESLNHFCPSCGREYRVATRSL